jgi:hypothetical protein
MPGITLYVPKRTYFGGDVIAGVITLNTATAATSVEFALTMRGEEKTQIKPEGKAHSRDRHTFLHDSQVFILSPEPGAEVLQPNTYYKQFALKLPSKLPASLKICDCAEICYKLKVKAVISLPSALSPPPTRRRKLSFMKRSDKQQSLKFSQDLIIGGNVFLESDFAVASPMSRTGSKAVWLGSISAKVTIPKSNFKIGEVCQITVNVENNSITQLKNVKAFLQETTTYVANLHSETKRWKHTDNTTSFGFPVCKKSSKTETLLYRIPDNVVTVCPVPGANSNIIRRVEIVLVFEIKNYPHFEITLPVTIIRPHNHRPNDKQEVACNHCQTPISTLRYKCNSCAYDLCYVCAHTAKCEHAHCKEDFTEVLCARDEEIDELHFDSVNKDTTNKVMKVLHPVGHLMGEMVVKAVFKHVVLAIV